MKFNIIFNPPWNTTKSKTSNGTGGDVGTWNKHYKKALTLLDSYMIMWAGKGGYLKLLREQTDVEIVAINLMTDKKYWNKNACCVTIHNIPKTTSNLDTVVTDRCAIIKCISVMGDNPNWKEINGGTNKKSVNYTNKDKVRAVTQLAAVKGKNKGPIRYGYVDPNYSGLSAAGPKFVGTLQESAPSYLVTNDPVAAPFMGCYSTSNYGDNIQNAENIKLFVQNSLVLKAIHQRLQTKGPTWTLRHIRPFDPSQIKTGYEIPVEWNLTPDEIDVLLGNII
jgi:hypothetical protein